MTKARAHQSLSATAKLIFAAAIFATAVGPISARAGQTSQQQLQELQRQIEAIQRQLAEAEAAGAVIGEGDVPLTRRNGPRSENVERFARDIERKAATDEAIARLCADIDYKKISYRSSVGDMNIPAYLFQPTEKRGEKGHPALVWVHGGVHSNFGASTVVYVKQALERGYIVIAPEYRGSTGYGQTHHEAIDYGGYEIDDSMTAYDYLVENLPHVDPERVGMIGWSHGGFITLHALARDQNNKFKCGYAGVPVTNLVFRLSYKGPGYENNFTQQERIGGEVHERRNIFIERSPLYHVDKIKSPVMVHVATNDRDVNFVECVQMIHALRAQIPHLAETKIYQDPRGGHGFDRLTNRENTAPSYTPELRDSWNRIWAFLEWNLRPYQDGAGNDVDGLVRQSAQREGGR